MTFGNAAIRHGLSLNIFFKWIDYSCTLPPQASVLFASLDEAPVGAASLAQVHIAETHSGERVAVKVQHKTVKELSGIDMRGMEVRPFLL